MDSPHHPKPFPRWLRAVLFVALIGFVSLAFWLNFRTAFEVSEPTSSEAGSSAP